MTIRPAYPSDRAALWAILEPHIRGGEAFALPRHMSEAEALAYWQAPGNQVFVAEEGGQVLGTYFLKANQCGGGDHVANCGYATSVIAQGRGVARRMLDHSLKHAKACGFQAMQFNFVVSTNERAVNTWLKSGFDIVGKLPRTFNHPSLGYVDTLVMFRTL